MTLADREPRAPSVQWKGSHHIEGNAMTKDTNPRAQLWELIKDIKFAMFTTRHPNGHLHSRPMTTQNKDIDENDRLWFFMSRSSDPVADLGQEAEVNVSYAAPDDDRYVSVSGVARVVTDPAKTQALWTKMAEAWFPAGPNDPDLALVEVQITHAHYWDVKESKITQLYKMAKAVLTDTPPKNLGETAEVRMR
jgi:general stress protein 26